MWRHFYNAENLNWWSLRAKSVEYRNPSNNFNGNAVGQRMQYSSYGEYAR